MPPKHLKSVRPPKTPKSTNIAKGPKALRHPKALPQGTNAQFPIPPERSNPRTTDKAPTSPKHLKAPRPPKDLLHTSAKYPMHQTRRLSRMMHSTTVTVKSCGHHYNLAVLWNGACAAM